MNRNIFVYNLRNDEPMADRGGVEMWMEFRKQ